MFLFLYVLIHVKIARQESKGHNIMKDGTFLEKNIYTVSDKSAAAELTVWWQHCIETGHWYSMNNISVRQYQNMSDHNKRYWNQAHPFSRSCIICSLNLLRDRGLWNNWGKHHKHLHLSIKCRPPLWKFVSKQHKSPLPKLWHTFQINDHTN